MNACFRSFVMFPPLQGLAGSLWRMLIFQIKQNNKSFLRLNVFFVLCMRNFTVKLLSNNISSHCTVIVYLNLMGVAEITKQVSERAISKAFCVNCTDDVQIMTSRVYETHTLEK